jgi:Zn-dependent protease
VIRDDLAKFVTALAGPCASEAPFVPADTRVIAMLQGSGALASRDAFQPGGDIHSWLAPWLLGIALMLAVAEIFVRRRKSQAAAFARARESTMASAA